jgi:ATP-dependent DNA helicase DinG
MENIDKDKASEPVVEEKEKTFGETTVDVLKAITAQLDGAEARPEQELATAAFAKSIGEQKHCLVQAPTGTGKSLAYLIPSVLSGKKIVISTATKQLSEQIVNKDVPFLKKALQNTDSPVKDFNAVLLKGRDNYFCQYKEAEGSRLDSQMGGGDGIISGGTSDSNKIAVEIRYIKGWAAKTTTGDRSEAPESISDKVWKQYSSNSSECIGKSACPFGASCFSELAREKAKTSNIVVTNHAVVAHDLISEQPILGEREVLIFDEVHELDKYFSDAWGTELNAAQIRDAAKTLKNLEVSVKELPENEFAISLLMEKIASTLKDALGIVEAGLIEVPYGALKQMLSDLRVHASIASAALNKAYSDKKLDENVKNDINLAGKKLVSIVESVDALMTESPEVVKWIESLDKEGVNKSLKTAPLRIGVKLQDKLEEKNAVMIGTSATIKVGGSFTIPMHNLGFDTVPNFEYMDLPSPFDFKKQSMLYIPDDTFPAPVGADRKDHLEASKAVSYELIKAMNGRAMVLTTTTYEVREIAEYLRKKFPKSANKVFAQGDMPNAQLVERYRDDEHSILVATMGLWHGVDIAGTTNSLIIVTKIPFRPMNDPLFQARREYSDSIGRDGFMDVFVAEANVMLTQAFGRLIRRKTDKGVVAILDTRLMTKRYGRDMLDSFPPISIYRNKEKVTAALERLSLMYNAKPEDNS